MTRKDWKADQSIGFPKKQRFGKDLIRRSPIELRNRREFWTGYKKKKRDAKSKHLLPPRNPIKGEVSPIAFKPNVEKLFGESKKQFEDLAGDGEFGASVNFTIS